MSGNEKLQKIFGVGPCGALISLLALLIAAWVDSFLTRPIAVDRAFWLQRAGIALVLAGMVLHGWSFVTLRSWWAHDKLCTRGPFRYFRHPMYAAWITFICPGAALLLNSWVYLFWAAALHPVWHRLVRTEEALMRATFGEVYREYAGRTRRFLPRIFNWATDGQPVPPNDSHGPSRCDGGRQAMKDKIIVREETPADIDGITEVTVAAFQALEISQHTEQHIISALRSAGALTVSLVAEVDGRLVGHIAFSPVTISDGTAGWYGLGPVSVRPSRQRQGIGQALIREGLARLRALGAGGCCLVGHLEYYPRFGFENMAGLGCEGVPGEVFFAMPFDGHTPRGVVSFHEGFHAGGSNPASG